MRGSMWFCIQRDESESCPRLCLAAVLQLIRKRLLIQQSVELTLCVQQYSHLQLCAVGCSILSLIATPFLLKPWTTAIKCT